jgi:hypothetical protein
MSHFQVRKWFGVVETIEHDGGPPADPVLKKAVAAVVIKNPFAGSYAEDLSALIDPSPELGKLLGEQAVELLGGSDVASYGKGGIAGVAGEQEHVVACLTTVFGDALRNAVGGGAAWISSATKTGAAGEPLDLPLAYKDALYVRSHYDTMSVSFDDGPNRDEVIVCWAFATRGRLNARLGGLKASDAKGEDGLV